MSRPTLDEEAANQPFDEAQGGDASTVSELDDCPRPYDAIKGDLFRPGVSADFLRRHSIRHVDESEAEALIGFKASGTIIPYPGHASPKLMLNGRQFSRLRLDQPTSTTKYLSPRGCGAQLYVPQGPPFGKELVVGEGEFKALALCEAGIRAVAVGGISSALVKGKLIPDLARVLTKYKPKIVHFLGDNDTAFIFEFSREAIKLAKALQEGCELRLPRIPLSMPKGIDDCRETLGGRFGEFWRDIAKSAVRVSCKLSPDALAVDIVIRELPAIKSHSNRTELVARLIELASHLDAIHLDLLARAVNESLQFSATSFRDTAHQTKVRRRLDNAEKSRTAKAEAATILNDPRPKIELPGANRLLSEFGAELAPLIKGHGYYVKDGVLVVPNELGNGLKAVTGRAFRTSIEKHVIPYHAVRERDGVSLSFDKTLNKEDAESLLVCPQFLEALPQITAINNARFPVLRSTGAVELLEEGYDEETGILTLAGGPEVEEWPGSVGANALRALLEEFCFREDDRERSISVTLAGMLTLFNSHLLPKGTPRPGFLYSGNSEGCGKSLLAKLAMIPRLGNAPTGCDPEDEQEIRKSIFAAALAASPVLFLDNVKKHLSSGSLEACMTASILKGRLLGQSREVQVENQMTVFITGNGATISPDMRRRLLIVELFLREARPEDRTIKHPMDDSRIQELRGEILSALWAITRSWAMAGKPKPRISHTSFPVWASIVGGILEHAGFASPCTQATTEISGDRDTVDMQKLVAAMAERHPKEDLKPGRVYELCREIGAFSRLVGENENDMENGKRNVLSRIFSRFNARIFSGGRTFRISAEGGKNSRSYYVE